MRLRSERDVGQYLCDGDTVNGASLEDAVNSYITEAEYYIDQ